MALRSLAAKLMIPAAAQRVGSRFAASVPDKLCSKCLNAIDQDIRLKRANSASPDKMLDRVMLLSAAGSFVAAAYIFKRFVAYLDVAYIDAHLADNEYEQ